MDTHWAYVALVATGGAFGGVARYWLSALMVRRFGARFPWGTLAVNVTGAAMMGILGGVLAGPQFQPIDTAWLILGIGVLGSYTTVSSFSLQTLALWQAGDVARAAANIVASLALCLAAAGSFYLATIHVTGAAG